MNSYNSILCFNFKYIMQISIIQNPIKWLSELYYPRFNTAIRLGHLIYIIRNHAILQLSNCCFISILIILFSVLLFQLWSQTQSLILTLHLISFQLSQTHMMMGFKSMYPSMYWHISYSNSSDKIAVCLMTIIIKYFSMWVAVIQGKLTQQTCT